MELLKAAISQADTEVDIAEEVERLAQLAVLRFAPRTFADVKRKAKWIKQHGIWADEHTAQALLESCNTIAGEA